MYQRALRREVKSLKKALNKKRDTEKRIVFAHNEQEYEKLKEEYGDELEGVTVFRWIF